MKRRRAQGQDERSAAYAGVYGVLQWAAHANCSAGTERLASARTWGAGDGSYGRAAGWWRGPPEMMGRTRAVVECSRGCGAVCTEFRRVGLSAPGRWLRPTAQALTSTVAFCIGLVSPPAAAMAATASEPLYLPLGIPVDFIL